MQSPNTLGATGTVPQAVIINPSTTSSATMPEPAAPKKTLMQQVVEIYWENALTLSFIILVPLTGQMILWELSPLKRGELLPLGFLWVFILLVLQSWGIISALNKWSQRQSGQPATAGSTYRIKQIFATAGVIILGSFLILGGFFLLILPGLYLLLYFSLALFLPVCEGTGAYHSLMTSKAYIKGREKELIPHLLTSAVVLAATELVMLTVTDFFGVAFLNSSLWGAGLLLITPLMISYFFLIFRKFRKNYTASAVYSGRNFSVWLTLAGYLVAAAAVFTWINPGLFRSQQAVSDDQKRVQDKQVIEQALQRYYNDIKSYPLTLDTLKPHYLSKIPFDPRYQLPYVYQSANDGQSYKLCLQLDTGLSCSGQLK